MTSQTFYLRTSNVEIIALFENMENKSKHLEECVLHCMSCEASTTEKELDLKYKKLRNNKMSLEMIKLVKDTGKSRNWDETKKIITAEKEVEPPKLIDNENNPELEEQKIDRNCSFCKHKHSDEPPHKCTDENCNCGVRG